jgi:dihydrofolate reductase
LAIQCSVFIATSLDGFIARTDGGIDWLTSGPSPLGGEDYGYADFINTIDALVMGRRTYELAASFPQWPYGSRRVFVLSTGYPGNGIALSKTVTGISSRPNQLVQMLSREGFQRVYVDGGKTILGFLRAGLINDMTITRIPILLGDGIPLFGVTGRDISLRHVATMSYPSGFVQSRYELMPAR